MKYHRAFLGVLLLTCAFVVSFTGASTGTLQGLSYTITPTGETDEYHILIGVSNISAGGLYEEFPRDVDVIETDMPEHSYKQEGNALLIALTGQDTLSMTVHCPGLKTGKISGVWEDLATGTTGKDEIYLTESGTATTKLNPEQTDATGPSGDGTPSQQSPLGICGIPVSLIALFMVTGLFTVSRRTQK